MEYIKKPVDAFNNALKDQSPLKVAAGAVAATLAARYAYDSLATTDAADRFERIGLQIASTFIPSVREEIEKTLSDAKVEIEGSYKRYEGEVIRPVLPAKGLTAEEILSEAEKHLRLDQPWKEGQVSGGIYHGGDEMADLLVQVYRLYHHSNPLHIDMFQSVKKMEAEIISMILDMFHAPKGACGALTSGGTGSILMAMKCYREQALVERRITKPNLVVPESTHPAFDKACHYLRIERVPIPCDPKTGRADVAAMKAAVNRNTIAMVCSAISFGVGTIDPIKELAPWCKKKGIGFHVDSCLGGFVVPFMEEAGFSVPEFDFRVEGVTSISADTHKYGFSPKGSSSVLYRDTDLRSHQYFCQPRWSGGIYASPTLDGSRSGALIASTWAALTFMGREGYVNMVRDIVTARIKIQEGLSKIQGIEIMGCPQASVVAFTSSQYDILQIVTRLTKQGWSLNGLQRPNGVHLCCTRLHTQEGVVDKFLNDTREAVRDLLSLEVQPPLHGAAALYGTAAKAPQSLVKDYARLYYDAYYQCVFDGEEIDEEGHLIKSKGQDQDRDAPKQTED